MRAGPGPGGRPQRDVRRPQARHAAHGADEEVHEYKDPYGLLTPEAAAGADEQYVAPAVPVYAAPPAAVPPYAVPPTAAPAQAGPPAVPEVSLFGVPVAASADLEPFEPAPAGPLTQAIPTGLRYGAGAAPAVPDVDDPPAARHPVVDAPRPLPRRRDVREARDEAPPGYPPPPPVLRSVPPGPAQFPPVQPHQIGGGFSPRPAPSGRRAAPGGPVDDAPFAAQPPVSFAPQGPTPFAPPAPAPFAPQAPAPFAPQGAAPSAPPAPAPAPFQMPERAPRAYRPPQPYEAPPQVASRAFETPAAFEAPVVGPAPYEPTAFVSGSLPLARRRPPTDDGPPSLLVPRVSAAGPGLLAGPYPPAIGPDLDGPDAGHRTRSPAADTGEGLLAPRRPDRRRDEGSHRTGPPKKGSAPSSALGAAVEVVVVVALALVLAVVVKTFFVQAFFIPSESMETTLLVGDRVLVSKLTPGPFALHHGDVVVFKDPDHWLQPSPPPDDGAVRSAVRSALTFVGLLPQDSGEHLIKRVIGLPGDTVKCCDAKGRLIVNGVPVDELYLQPGVAPSDKTFSITVPEGRLWVMGDNRPFSADSRYHMDLAGGGTVPVSDVVGKAFVIVWPFARAGGLGTPDSVFADVPAAPGGS